MILDLITYPNPILNEVSEPVEKVDDDIRTLLDDMHETMEANNGTGLAAPQIGVSLRVAIVVVEKSKEAYTPDYTGLGNFELINPEIIERDGDIEWEEGCLSVPGFYYIMNRSHRITVRYLNREGKEETLKAEGLLAVAIQQEIDHLDGKLIIDNASRLKQSMYLHRRKKEKKKKDKEKADIQ